MEEKISKQMIYPAKVRVIPNCKLVKISANQTAEGYNELITGKTIGGILEKKKSKKHGNIISTYTITNADGYDGTDPLNVFDYAVLSVCISEQLASNDCTTAAVILRGLTGKVGKADEGVKLYPEQRAAIMDSVRKMMSTNIRIDNSTVNEELGYVGKKIIEKQILPAYFETTTINGQVVEDTIYFYHDDKGNIVQSPIFEVADQRNQIIRYDTELLDVPNQNNTPLIITIKNYVILRVMEIIKHKMTPTITLDDIFKKCRINAADKKYNVNWEVKNTVDKFLEHLQAKGVIDSFSWKKKGVKIYGVEFTF